MDKLVLILVIIIFLIIYLFICDCILKKKEQFKNESNYLLHRGGIQDIKAGGYFGQGNDKLDLHIPLRAMSNSEKHRMKGLVNSVLKNINKQLKLKFEVVDIEHISQRTSDDGNRRLLLDVFTWEKLNHYNRRLILDITLDYQVNKIIVNNIMLANSKNIQASREYKEHYFHQPILSQDNLENKHDIFGVSDSKLAFNQLDYVNEYTNQKNFKEWILPKEYLEKINSSLPVWPCREEDFRWNTNAVNQTESETSTCNSINSSYEKPVYTPKFNPSMRQVNLNSPYNWIFGHLGAEGTNKGWDAMLAN